MGIYLKEFGTHTEYENYIGGGAILPNVSVCDDEKDVHYNPLPEFAVDLGLPSGRLWADRNVGAASPEAYGDFFMWGSVTPDTEKSCDWAHAPFNDGATAFNETYFNEHKSEWLDGDVLKPEYDAAHAIMGGNWRMPTSAEMQELLDNTTQSTEELNGISGKRFTSNANGNSIFMPFAGWRTGPSILYRGDDGCAWSSSLYAGSDGTSHSLSFGRYGRPDVRKKSSYYGYTVRGVC